MASLIISLWCSRSIHNASVVIEPSGGHHSLSDGPFPRCRAGPRKRSYPFGSPITIRVDNDSDQEETMKSSIMKSAVLSLCLFFGASIAGATTVTVGPPESPRLDSSLKMQNWLTPVRVSEKTSFAQRFSRRREGSLKRTPEKLDWDCLFNHQSVSK